MAVEANDVLDEVKLAALERLIGAAEMDRLTTMLGHELATRPATIARLAALGRRDAAMEQAHALKGAALNVGAVRVGDLAHAVERACDGDAPLDDLLRDLAAAAAATCAALDRRRAA